MDDSLKQRLVGAVVLLALAVIFVPVLFDRERLEPIDSRTRIPPAPEIPPLDIPEPATPEWVEAVPEPEIAVVAEEDIVVQSLAQAPAAVQGDERAWVLQVASFRSDQHAGALKSTLEGLGYPAYTRKVSYKNGDITRVFVGPKLNKTALREAKVTIDRDLKVESILMAFTPG